jgi:UDP-N-acetylglucosamine--N-acetylmuramyl-(pentapeptide) pyrophosphoryl-undecaprenol N-acetylglucosamine transferase
MQPNLEVLWVGGERGLEADLVKRAGVSFEAIPAAGVHGVGLRALPKNLGSLGRGFIAARRILNRFQPQVLFFTGGYVAVPVALAASVLHRRPRPSIHLYTPDIEPGLALKTLARFSDQISITVDASRGFYPRHPNIHVTGYPVRKELLDLRVDREAARNIFGLSLRAPVILVMGGSSGARSLNRVMLAILPQLLEETQVIHITGNLDWREVEAAHSRLAPVQQARYRIHPYLHTDMAAAFHAADLIVSRAGASTLGELPAFSLPAVLVPYPYAWRYQHVNAKYLAQKGAALIVEDERLSEQLLPVLRDLLSTPDQLASMRQAMKLLYQPEAANNIASILVGSVQSKENSNRMGAGK